MSRGLSNNAFGIYNTLTNPSKLFSNESLIIGMLYIICSPQYFYKTKNIYDNIVQHTIFFATLLTILGISKNKVILASVLFIVTSPGFVFEIPSKDTFYTNESSTQSIVVHSAIFTILYNALLH